MECHRRRLPFGLEATKSHPTMAMAIGMDPVAAETGILGRHQDVYAAVGLIPCAVFLHMAAAALIGVEIFLPHVAELEDPIVTGAWREGDDESLIAPACPGSETVMSIGHPTVREVDRAAEADPVRTLAQIVLPPAAHQFAIAEHHLSGLGERVGHIGRTDRATRRPVDALRPQRPALRP